jgi:pyruvyltransferase
MKVFWDQCGPGAANFGDRLTPLILSYIGISCEWATPGQADLIGIGSVLEAVPPGFRGAIWTAGRMYADSRIDLREANVLALRGRLTLEGVKLGPASAPRLGDGGLLCGIFAKPRRKTFKLGIIPHYVHANSRLVADLAASSPDIKLIDICGAPQEILAAIGSCHAVVSSSLHGLIAADALEIPNSWIELDAAAKVGGQGFKYRDYYSVFGIPIPGPHRVSESDTLESLLRLTSTYQRPGLERIRADLERTLYEVANIAGPGYRASRPGAELAASLKPVAARERDFLVRLASPYFAVTGAGTEDMVPLELFAPELQSSSTKLAEFFCHCLTMLGQLRSASISHDNIRWQTLFIRDGRPVLGDFSWAKCTNTVNELEADLLAFAALFRKLNGGKCPLFDDVIKLMEQPDAELRIDNLACLAELFAAAATASSPPGDIESPRRAGADVVQELICQVRKRDERLHRLLERQWTDNAYLARLEIEALLRPRGTVIVVDEAALAPTFDGGPFLPFLERDGGYWGPPPDDETAVAELERLRSAGAEYIAFTWPAFWWLDYYVGFARYLSANFASVLVNPRLRVFALKQSP